MNIVNRLKFTKSFSFQGIIYINGFNLGRYWATVGPQITLYLPKELLVNGRNKLVLIEYEKAPPDLIIQFSKVPIFD